MIPHAGISLLLTIAVSDFRTLEHPAYLAENGHFLLKTAHFWPKSGQNSRVFEVHPSINSHCKLLKQCVLHRDVGM
jgi:hypothetical protein